MTRHFPVFPALVRKTDHGQDLHPGIRRRIDRIRFGSRANFTVRPPSVITRSPPLDATHVTRRQEWLVITTRLIELDRSVPLPRGRDIARNRTDDEQAGRAPIQPLAYAYMRVPCNIPDDKVRRMEHELRRFAEGKGWCLAETFYEFRCGAHEAFNDLIAELQRTGATTVIVPTLRHLARNTLLQNVLLSRLEFDADADVFELVETT
jgi:hypothetical protein